MFSFDGLVGKTIVSVKSNGDDKNPARDVALWFSDGTSAQLGAEGSHLVIGIETPNILLSRKRGGCFWHMELAYWFFGLRMPRRAEGVLLVEENFCEVF